MSQITLRRNDVDYESARLRQTVHEFETIHLIEYVFACSVVGHNIKTLADIFDLIQITLQSFMLTIEINTDITRHAERCVELARAVKSVERPTEFTRYKVL